MRKIALFLIAALVSSGAFAADAAKKAAAEDITKQETVSLGNNRFLIFSGTANGEGQYGYTLDLIKIDDGIPHFDPLFMEEYHPETNTAKLEYGIAFLASSYHFDKANNSLTYTIQDEKEHTRMQLRYKLYVDIFKLEQVDSQSTACAKPACAPAPPKTVYKANTNAQTH